MSHKASQRVALFGGTFDPVHRGHLYIAGEAVAECGLDRVIFLPCWKSPHKHEQAISDSQHRVAMLQLATRGVAWAEVSEWEVRRAESSYSWKTAQHFAEELGDDVELFWIVGTDQWEVIETWARPDVLAALVTFVVFPRGRQAEPKQGFEMVSVNASFDASSTEIRRRVRAGEETSDLVLPEVGRYIETHRLYR